ncbi:DUF6519 domain-containing protein [Nonomuraea sp. NPDC050556]|uniref:DUF6519 domain-containing protein n=1 Tax=Nonomuraea sp. NPDC050556 TaxID=3364369 RepID=UPI0037A3CC03
MGDFSRTTFDRMKHYVGVRLQQGVPIVDADWNEQEDIRRYELQAFLKWFVGDGVPAGNDGFLVAPLPGGGVGTIRLASRSSVPGQTSVSVDVGASTAAAALGFTQANRSATRSGSNPAQLTGVAAQPFALAAGLTLVLSADGAAPETVTFAAGAFATIGAATAAEVVAATNAAVSRVAASAGAGDDFAVMGGDGTPEGAGRCLVDGRDAVTETQFTYSSQPLFDNAVLAAEWGVPVVQPLSAGDRDDLVYLDVWDREVTSAEDDSLVNPLIGVESCVRVRREWAVRVRTGAAKVPAPGDSDFRPQHSYLALAVLARKAGVPAVGVMSDLRPRSLLVPPSTLIEDVFGTSADSYRRGENRPLTNLREAINALMRGELPGTPDTPIAPAAAQDFMSTAFTVAGGDVVALWHSRRAANVNQVFLTRWPLNAPGSAATTLPVQVTPGPVAHAFPASVALPGGDLIVVYETAGQDIFAKRGTPQALAGATEFAVASAATTDRQPFAVLSGEVVVFLWQQIAGAARTWLYRRWRHATNTFVDATAQQLSAATAALLSGGIGDFSAAVDGSGDVWAAFRADDGGGNFSIRLLRLRPTTLQLDEQTISSGGANEQPFVLVDGSEAVWVFWRSGTDAAASVSYQRVPLPAPATWPVQPPPVAVTGAAAARPGAVRDAQGAVWLFWSQLTGVGTTRAVWLQRHLKSTNSWGTSRQITGSAAVDDQPFALTGPGGTVLLFWLSSRSGNLDLFSKQFITAL